MRKTPGGISFSRRSYSAVKSTGTRSRSPHSRCSCSAAAAFSGTTFGCCGSGNFDAFSWAPAAGISDRSCMPSAVISSTRRPPRSIANRCGLITTESPCRTENSCSPVFTTTARGCSPPAPAVILCSFPSTISVSSPPCSCSHASSTVTARVREPLFR